MTDLPDLDRRGRWQSNVANFAPSWFTVTMGTGITAILLHDLPYNARWLYWLSVIVFVLNVVLFIIFLVATLARCLLWPGSWTAMLYRSDQNLFLSAVPMSLGTIVSMTCYVCVDAWGTSAQYLAITLWLIEAVLAVACVLITPYFLVKTDQGVLLSKVTARHIFPVVACVVASASGSALAAVITNPQHALWVVLSSYVLWGIGMPMAMMILTIYLQRLFVHGLPPRELIVSVFIPIGPFGQGGFAILSLGGLTTSIFPQTHTLHGSTSGFLYDLGFFVALLCWSGALLWTLFAIVSIYLSKKGFPFNVGWWTFVFPLATFAQRNG